VAVYARHTRANEIKKLLVKELFYLELGCKDSNLGMSGPKPDALPLGDTPIILLYFSVMRFSNFFGCVVITIAKEGSVLSTHLPKNLS
jgi:hypothetical protein